MATEAKSISSSAADLRIAEEASIGVLPGSPQWVRIPVFQYPATFGLNQTLEAQRTISQRRRDRKGDIASTTADAGVTVYFTPTVLEYLVPYIFLSDTFSLPEHGGELSGDTLAVTTDGYDIGTAAAAAGYLAGHLVFAEHFGVAANNGLKVVESTTSDVVDIVGGLTAEASPPARAIVSVVGFRFGVAEADIVHDAGELPYLEDVSVGGYDFTTFGLRVGQWIYIGSGPSGVSTTKFTNPENNGPARIAAITATRLVFDRTSGDTVTDPPDPTAEMVDETGTGKTISIYFSNQTKDEQETSTLFNRRTAYQERALGRANPVSAPTEVQTEDVKGTLFGNTVFTINRQESVKVAITAIGVNAEEHLGSVGDPNTSSGDTIVDLPFSGFFAAGSQVKLLRVGPSPDRASGDAATDPLFEFASQFTITLDNGASLLTAVGSETGFDINVGTFTCVIEFTNYFVSVQSKRTIRLNDDVTFHCLWARNIGADDHQVGVLLDLPTGALSGGSAEVVIDQSVTSPLTLRSGDDENVDASFTYNYFKFLPGI